MKRSILFLTALFFNIFSYAQYDFLKESLKDYVTTAPSYLVVKVKSLSYEGEAAVTSNDFYSYYKKKVRGLNRKNFYKPVYRDIKRGKYFIIADEDFLEEHYNFTQKYYVFEKIIVNDSILNISKKGIEFFIRTYFDEAGDFDPPFSYKSDDFPTIVKVMFEAGIRTGIGCIWSEYHIQDSRFYKKYEDGKVIEYVYPEVAKFVIPPEYRDSKE
jgi:hypothetical protein